MGIITSDLKVCLSSASSVSFNLANCQPLPSIYTSSATPVAGMTDLHSFSMSDTMIRIDGQWNYQTYSLPITAGTVLNKEAWISYSDFRTSFAFVYNNVGYYRSVVDGRLFAVSGIIG